MNNDSNTDQHRWRLFFALVMASALAITLAGTIIFLRPQETNGPMSGLGAGLFFLIWAFGLTGLCLCHIGHANGRWQMTLIGFTWSILSLTWDSIARGCNVNDPCAHDTSDNGWMIAICLMVFASLLVYDKTREKIPPASQMFIKVIVRTLIAAWVGSLLFIIAMFNQHLPLQIDRTAHPLTQQSAN